MGRNLVERGVHVLVRPVRVGVCVSTEHRLRDERGVCCDAEARGAHLAPRTRLRSRGDVGRSLCVFGLITELEGPGEAKEESGESRLSGASGGNIGETQRRRYGRERLRTLKRSLREADPGGDPVSRVEKISRIDAGHRVEGFLTRGAQS
ncbi:hypothetical protein DFH11DRAFT_1679432 [Phellopilus nigrolimitatus]|nr:hypothetical protein DFH11DRAFT_1679432 [Phellopilus nigrolimitatus]